MSARSKSEFPDWALLCRKARISDHRNTTTAESHTSEGQPVAVTFWLVDPPGISYFSVNCPGLKYKYQAWLHCAEAAFILFRLTLGSSHFVYTARDPAGKQPSLRLLPQPRPTFFAWQKLGLLSCDRQHYVVAFLERNWSAEDDVWRFDAHVFSSKTRTWSTAEASHAQLSDSQKRLCCRHDFSRQITANASSLGWVDIDHGILLLRNLFDGHPVIDLIPLRVPNVGFPGEDDNYYCASEYFCNVASCDNSLIKFVEIKHDDVNFLTCGKGWRATMWNRRFSWDGWQKRCTVHVDDISIDQSYSALLPELLDDGTQELELKKLFFYGPILSVHDDDLLYMMTKVNAEDDDGWAVVIDMKCAAVEALTKFSVEWNPFLNAMCCPCVFPKYLNMASGGSSFFLPDDDPRGNLRKKRKKRKRSNRRKKKQQPVS